MDMRCKGLAPCILGLALFLFVGVALSGVAFARTDAERALELWRSGRIAEAAQRMEAFLRVCAEDPEAWNDFGMMNLALGQLDEAEKAFARALSLKPGHAGACLNMGNILRHRGQEKRALEWFDTGVAWHAQDTRLRLARAQMHVQMRDYAAAREDLRAAFAVAPANTHVLNEYAWFLATCPDKKMRDGTRALELARAAVQSAPGPEAGLYDTLAAALAACGHFKEAAETQKKALDLARAHGYPGDLLESWRERYGLYKLNMPYQQHVDTAY